MLLGTVKDRQYYFNMFGNTFLYFLYMNQAYILLERSLFINNLVCICGQIASNPGIRVDKLGGTYFTTSHHFFNQTLRCFFSINL